MTRDRDLLLGEIGVLDDLAIHLHFDLRPLQADADLVPLLRFINLLRRRERAVKTAGEFGILCLGFLAKVRHLHFNLIEGGIALHRSA